jgi:hypothetical protein
VIRCDIVTPSVSIAAKSAARQRLVNTDRFLMSANLKTVGPLACQLAFLTGLQTAEQPVAAGLWPAVEPVLPARADRTMESTTDCVLGSLSGGRMRALYVRRGRLTPQIPVRIAGYAAMNSR